MNCSLRLVTLLVSLYPVSAQSVVVPPVAAEHWGWKNRDFPMGRSWCRTQIRVDRSMLPTSLPVPVLLRSIGVRRATGRAAFRTTTIQQEIWFGSTSAVNSTFSTNFATNRAAAVSAAIVVPRRQIRLPAVGFGSPSDFVMIPFQTAHLFTGPHALIEFDNQDTRQQLNDWRIDYVGTTAAGVRRYFGFPCNGAGATSVSSSGGAGNYTLGASVNFWSGGGPANVNALHLLGLSVTSWNGLPLPLDFAPFGAPGCRLYVDALLMQSFARNANGQVSRKAPIPNSSALGSLTLYTQWANFDVAANPMGLSLTEATAITIGAPRITGIQSTRLVSLNNNTDPVGMKFSNEMPVLRWDY